MVHEILNLAWLIGSSMALLWFAFSFLASLMAGHMKHPKGHGD